MATKTKADLRRMMLSHLGVIDPTEEPEAEQAALANLWIDGARDQLLEDGLCWWDADAIPGAVIVPLSRYVAALACKAFGRAGRGFEADEDKARGQVAGLKSGEERPTVMVEYF